MCPTNKAETLEFSDRPLDIGGTIHFNSLKGRDILHNGRTDLWQPSACNPFFPEMSDEPSVRSNERNCPKLCAPRIQKNKIAQEETTMQHHNIPETSSCNISPCVSNLKVKMRFKIKPQAILPSLQLLKSRT